MSTRYTPRGHQGQGIGLALAQGNHNQRKPFSGVGIGQRSKVAVGQISRSVGQVGQESDISQMKNITLKLPRRRGDLYRELG